jgi:hypothetical protein
LCEAAQRVLAGCNCQVDPHDHLLQSGIHSVVYKIFSLSTAFFKFASRRLETRHPKYEIVYANPDLRRELSKNPRSKST